MPSYILTSNAEKDLHQIWLYTYKKWGLKQADHYLDLLEKKMFRNQTGKTALEVIR